MGLGCRVCLVRWFASNEPLALKHMPTENNKPAIPANVIEHEGFTLSVKSETTQGRKGATGKSYFTVDFNELLAVKQVMKRNAADTADESVKIEDYETSGANLLKWFRGWDSLMAFLEAEFDKAMVSLQVTTPANAKTPKTLSDAEKLAALREYVATIEKLSRQRSGAKSELNRLVKEQSELMKNFTADVAGNTVKLVALATAIANAQAKLDTEAAE